MTSLSLLSPLSHLARSGCFSFSSCSKPLRNLTTAAVIPHAKLQPLSAITSTLSDELEGVMCLTMDREKARNALSVQMVAEMREGIAKVDSSTSTRLLLLHSSHSAFCAGADLIERRSMSPSQVTSFLDSLNSLILELEGLKCPTVAVVDGFAMGGGSELALGCDLRVAGPGAVFSLPEVKLGIIPGAGGTQRLTRLVGPARAKGLIFTGKRVGAEEAGKIGLVDVVATDSESGMEAALVLARQVVTSAPLALRAAKSAISSATSLPLHQGLALERKMYNTLLGTEDRQEGLRAFAEKRRAVFQGR